jgi:prevent-host-death family protein
MYYIQYVLESVRKEHGMPTITATQARTDLFNLLKKTIKGHQPVRIASKDGEAVLLSGEDYENLLETLHLVSIPGLKVSLEEADREIAAGKTLSMDDVFG